MTDFDIVWTDSLTSRTIRNGTNGAQPAAERGRTDSSAPPNAGPETLAESEVANQQLTTSEPATESEQQPPLHTCRKCHQSVPLEGDRCSTPRCGAALPGNRLTLRDGARSARSGADLFPEAAAALRERETAILGDLGGADSVSEVKRELVTRFVQAAAIADSLGQQLASGGVTSAKGRPRAAVSLYLSVLDRLTRLAGSIGLERQQKPAASLADVLAAHEEQPHG